MNKSAGKIALDNLEQMMLQITAHVNTISPAAGHGKLVRMLRELCEEAYGYGRGTGWDDGYDVGCEHASRSGHAEPP